MPLRISIAHDFSCRWCWVGLSQARRLRREFGADIEWLGYEMVPDGTPFPERPEFPPLDTRRPPIPSRFELFVAAEGVIVPDVPRPEKVRTHRAHQAVAYASTFGKAEEMVERVYRAYWEWGWDIDDPAVLARLAQGLVPDVDEMMAAVAERRFADRIVPFDKPAFATGVYHVPTFFIGDERHAEQPYEVLRQAAMRQGVGAWGVLEFEPAPLDRPTVFANMVSTVDGKTVTGSRDEPVQDLGSKFDQRTMRQIGAHADAVLIGAGTLRATPGLWYPSRLWRFVASRSGKVDRSIRFFADAPDKAFVLTHKPAKGPGVRAFGEEELDWVQALKWMRQSLGIERLLVEGGSELNASLMKLDLVDELFLTLAPKVKLGRDVPTYAGGDPLPRDQVQKYYLLDLRRFGDEVFLRYRRDRGGWGT